MASGDIFFKLSATLCFSVELCVAQRTLLKILTYKFLLAFLLGTFFADSSAQEEQASDIISYIAEELADDEKDPEAVAICIEKLHDLQEAPVMINSADETELSRLFFLTDFQIRAISDYIHSSGKILSVFEIANIPGFDRKHAEMVIPFISIDAEKPEAGRPARFRNNLLSNLSVKFSGSDTISSGSPLKSLTRYKFTAGKLAGGFTAEKDAGEKLLTGDPPMPDFISANLSWTGSGILRKIIIGDYGARFGLGTNINTSLRTGLSLTQAGYLSGVDEIKPYTSTDENNFFRGAAAHMQNKNISISIFCSLRSLDATIDTAENGSDLFVKTFQKSGLHNTLSSIRGKDAVRESFYGINLASNFSNLRTGLIWTVSRFSVPVGSSHEDPEKIYDFEGSANSIATAYYKLLSGRIFLYGEVSADMNKRLALVQGLAFRPADRLSVNFLYRDYNPGFTSLHGKGPFSSSAGDNIKGLFGNFTFEAARHFFITAGCDIRYCPWLKYRCSAPSMGISKEVQIKYMPSDRLTFEAFYNYRSSMYDNKEEFGVKKQSTITNRFVKFRVRYLPADNFSLTTRLDYKTTQPGSLKGMVLLQDINYSFTAIPVSIWVRYCLFKTDGWDSRIYVFENDLLYNFCIPAFSGIGSRSCMMVTWNAGKSFSLRVKYGLTEIEEEYESRESTKELRIQLRMWF